MPYRNHHVDPHDIPIPFPINRIFVPYENWYRGRDLWTPDVIVIHATEGGRDSVIRTFQNVLSGKCTHFMVCKDGEVIQFLGTQHTAYGNGLMHGVTDPTVLSRMKLHNSNPNLYTISIEHELLSDEIPTAAQYAASAALLKLLSAKWEIPLDSQHVIPHKAIDARKTCPNNVDIGHLLGLCA